MSDLVKRLRSGSHNRETTALAGVFHDARCLEAADRIEALEALLKEAAVELTDNVHAEYSPESLAYPSVHRSYERDMDLPNRIRAALGDTGSDTDA